VKGAAPQGEAAGSTSRGGAEAAPDLSPRVLKPHGAPALRPGATSDPLKQGIGQPETCRGVLIQASWPRAKSGAARAETVASHPPALAG